MDLDRIRDLLNIVAESGVSEVEIEDGDLKIVVRRTTPTVTVQQSGPAYPYPPPYAPQHPASYPPPYYNTAQQAPAHAQQPPTQAAPAAPGAAATPAEAPSAAASANRHQVCAPIVGTFYRTPSPDADAYVSVGDTVKPGDVLCIIEAMKLMNEVECEVTGVVREILVENAKAVEYDQALFVIETA